MFSMDQNKKRVILNIITNLSYELIIVIFGLIIPRLFLVRFGSSINGLDSTVKNIFAYLTLLEAGVGLSAQYALYKPIAKGNREDINGVLSATRLLYKKSGVLYAALTVLLATVYPLFVESELGYFLVCAAIMIYGVPGIILFWVRGKYTAFLEAEGKQYILTIPSAVILIITNALKLVFLLISDNFLLIQITYCVPSILQIIFITWYVRKKYPWINWKAKPDYSALNQKNSVLIHQICGCVFSNTDTFIVSVLCGMNYASVYAVFMLFFNNLQKIVTSFTKGITFSFGQMYQTETSQFERSYSMYETVYYTGLFILYTVVTLFLLPIIRLYTSGITDSHIYDNTLFLLLSSITTLFTALETPQHQLVSVAGRFSNTKNQAVIEMSINIVVSIAATLKFGLAGCLVGTFVALLYRVNALIIYTSKNILDRSVWTTYKKVLVNMAVYALIVGVIGVNSCLAKSYFYVVLKAAMNMLWIAPVYLIVNILFNRQDYIEIFKAIKEYLHKFKAKKA